MTSLLHPARCLHTLPLLYLLFAAFALTGCGGGDGDGTTNTTPATGNAPPPTLVLSLAVQDIKTLRFNWTGTDQASSYRLFVESDASAARVAVATLPAGTTQHDLQVFLPDQVNARYTLQVCNAAACADAASVAVETALVNKAVGYFKAALPNGDMGQSVALSSDGSTLAVGAYDDDHQVTDSGAVYVFNRGATGWVQKALLQAPAPSAFDGFGMSIALSSDGQRLLVGAPGYASRRGAIFVFTSTNGQWDQEWFQADPFPWAPQDFRRDFGWAVAISGDGNTLVAGRSDDDYTALVFSRTSGQWAMEATIAAAAFDDAKAFALSGNGDTLLVGRPRAVSAAGVCGAVDVYERSNNTWQLSARLTSSNPEPGDFLGVSVAIARDGQTIAVGAIWEDGDATGVNRSHNNSAVDSGAVYVFVRTGNGWTEQAYIKASNTEGEDQFGYAVALSSDGNSLAVTAVDEDSSAQGLNGPQGDNTVNAAGAAYVFRRQGGVWHQSSYVKATNTGALDLFGESVALSGDGLTLAVGTTSEGSVATGVNGDQEDNSAPFSGAVYLY